MKNIVPSLKEFIEEKEVAKISKDIHIDTTVNTTTHSEDRLHRPGFEEIKQDEINKDIETATPIVAKLMIKNKIDIGENIHIFNSKTDLNIIAGIEKDLNTDFKVVLITVMRKHNFIPKDVSYSLTI